MQKIELVHRSFNIPMRMSSCNSSPSARRVSVCSRVQDSNTAQHFPSSIPSLDQYLQSLIPPRWCSIFCRGKRTGNLPDEVRAQVLVNGGHCEGCAGDDSSCRNSSSSSRAGSISPIARASEIRESSALPRKARLLRSACLRQRLSNSRHQGTGCWWKLGAGVCASVRGM